MLAYLPSTLRALGSVPATRKGKGEEGDSRESERKVLHPRTETSQGWGEPKGAGSVKPMQVLLCDLVG